MVVYSIISFYYYHYEKRKKKIKLKKYLEKGKITINQRNRRKLKTKYCLWELRKNWALKCAVGKVHMEWP